MRTYLSLALLCSVIWTKAQDNERISFKKAIETYQSELGIKFSFDAEVLALISEDRTFSSNSFETFISEVQAALPLSIDAVDEKYFTIAVAESTYNLQVSDSLDNKPLPVEMGVIVLVNNQPIKVTITANGYSFDYKPSQKDVLEVFTAGFDRRKITFKDLLNGRDLSVSLSIRTIQLAGVTVEDYLTKGVDINPSKQSITIKVSDLPLLPGETDGDIFASIAALPGVTTPDGRAGNLMIRGSETDQTLILFDNIPVYHRGHYFGTISPYNPKVVNNVEVYRSGFHPRLGDRVGGAVIINTDPAPSESVVGAGANLLFGLGYVKVPLANKKMGFSFGARKSHPSSFQSPKLKAISQSVFSGTAIVNRNGEVVGDVDVNFEDYQAKWIWNLNQKNNLSASGIYTNSTIQYSVRLPNATKPPIPEHNDASNSGLSINWNSKLSSNWQSNLTGTVSNYLYNYYNHQIAPTPDLKALNELKDFNIREEFSRSGDKTNYQIGLDYKWQEVKIDYQNQVQNNSTYTYTDQTQANSYSPYANLEFFGFKKWYFQLGIRATYYDLLKDFSVAPRLLINHDVTDWITLKASTGKYNQYLSQVKNLEYSSGGFDNELWTLEDNNQGHIIRGVQSMAGALIHSNGWILDIESFRKTADKITVYEDRRLNDRSTYFTMNQLTYGLDLLLKKQVTDRTSIWVGYSYADSKISLDTTKTYTYQSKYVQPSVWYIGGAYNYKRWKLSAAYKYGSGLNAQSLDIIFAKVIRDRNIANQPPGTPIPPDPFADLEDRYPNVSMLDFSASYKIPKTAEHKWNASFGLSLINVLDQKNLIDRVYRGTSGFQDRYGTGFAPNLMVIVEW